MTAKLYKSFGYKAFQIIGFTLYSALLIPILIAFWDKETYGAWIAIYAMYNLIQVVEFGHNTYVGNAFNAIVNTNVTKAKSLIGSAMRTNFLAGLLQMTIVLVLYLLGAFKFFIQSELSDSEIATVLFFLFLYRFLIGSYRGLFIKMLNPFGYIYKSYQFSLIERSLEFIILVSSAASGISLIETAILWLSVKSAFSLCVLWYIKNTLTEFFPWWQSGSFKEGLLNFKKSSVYIATNFLDRSAVDGLLLLVSALIGSSFLPVFIGTRTLVNFGGKIAEVFLGPLTPELINLHAVNLKGKLIRFVNYYWFATGLILTTGFLSTLWLAEPLFNAWTGGKLEFRPLLYYGLIAVQITQNYGSVLYAYLMGINNTRVVFKTALLRILLLFPGIYLFHKMGIKGIVIAMFITEFVRSIIWLPYWHTKELSIPITSNKSYWLNPAIVAGVVVFLYFDRYNRYLVPGLALLLVFLFYLQFELIPKTTRQKFREILQSLRKKFKRNGR